MPPETTEETESLDKLGEGLPENVRAAVADLLKAAARVQEGLRADNMEDGMNEAAMRVHMLSEDLADKVQRGLAEVGVERGKAEKVRRLAEGYDMF